MRLLVSDIIVHRSSGTTKATRAGGGKPTYQTYCNKRLKNDYAVFQKNKNNESHDESAYASSRSCCSSGWPSDTGGRYAPGMA